MAELLITSARCEITLLFTNKIANNIHFLTELDILTSTLPDWYFFYNIHNCIYMFFVHMKSILYKLNWTSQFVITSKTSKICVSYKNK